MIWNCLAGTGSDRHTSFSHQHTVDGQRAVNSLCLNPRGSRLVVHTRNNLLRTIDTKSFVEYKQYSGLRNERLMIRSDVSPDGRYIVSGSEDGKVYALPNRRSAQLCVIPHSLCTHQVHLEDGERGAGVLQAAFSRVRPGPRHVRRALEPNGQHGCRLHIWPAAAGDVVAARIWPTEGALFVAQQNAPLCRLRQLLFSDPRSQPATGTRRRWRRGLTSCVPVVDPLMN